MDRRAAAPAADQLRHSQDARIRCYGSTFADLMEMRAPAATVAGYLDRHEGWFRRCAAPMAANRLPAPSANIPLATKIEIWLLTAGSAAQLR